MEALWKRSPQTASSVFKEVQDATGWALNTVRTLLSRLVEKGALHAEKNEAGVAEFRPAAPREVFVKAESETFLQRVFQGAANSLLLHFVQHAKLTPKESEELKRLFEENATRKG